MTIPNVVVIWCINAKILLDMAFAIPNADALTNMVSNAAFGQLITF